MLEMSDRSVARDMSRTDWRGLLSGFLKFLREEMREPEHADDALPTLATAANSGVPQAASVMFVGPSREILFVKRSDKEKNWPGVWALPGGKVDDGETAEDCARREAREEVGYDSDADVLDLLDEKDTEHGWHHTTYLCRVAERFDPKLNDEHSEFVWALPDDPPEPLHSGVAATLEGFEDRIEALTEGEGDSSLSELGTALRGPGAVARQIPKNPIGKDGDLRITHQIDATPLTREANRGTPDVGRMSREVRRDRTDHSVRRTGSALDVRLAEDRAALAFDRDSVREKDVDGHMRVSVANISKANICPYIGKEIPGWKELGLDPDKRYNLLRDPEELEKSAESFNGKPILSKHQPLDAASHPPELVIGSVGTDAGFSAPYLTNSLIFWPNAAIESIENDDHRQLSAAYRYDADMIPGTYEGRPYDGVMRNIVGNHVALVREGRAGSDVVVGDEMPRGWTAPKWGTPMATGRRGGWTAPRWATGMAMDAYAPGKNPASHSRAGHERSAQIHKDKAIEHKKAGEIEEYGHHVEAASFHRNAAQSHPNKQESDRADLASKLANQGKRPSMHGAMDAVVAMDPLTDKGEEIMRGMKDQYGSEKGERVFYASRNKGNIKGVDRKIGRDVGAESVVGGKRTGYRINTDAEFEESKHKRDHGKFSSGGGSSGGNATSGGSGKVSKSGRGPAGKIELVHGAGLSDVTRGGRKVGNPNQSAVRVTSPDGKVSHTYFGNSDSPGSQKKAAEHFDFMTGGSSSGSGKGAPSGHHDALTKAGYKLTKAPTATTSAVYSHPEGHQVSVAPTGEFTHYAGRNGRATNKATEGKSLGSLQKAMTKKHVISTRHLPSA